MRASEAGEYFIKSHAAP